MRLLLIEDDDFLGEGLRDRLPDRHPLLGRAKDLGSAAVMFCLLQVLWVWAVALWP